MALFPVHVRRALRDYLHEGLLVILSIVSSALLALAEKVMPALGVSYLPPSGIRFLFVATLLVGPFLVYLRLHKRHEALQRELDDLRAKYATHPAERALLGVHVTLGNGEAHTGVELFGVYGGLFGTNIKGAHWVGKVRNHIARSGAYAGEQHDLRQLDTALTEVLTILSDHRLIDTQTPTTVMFGSREFFLTPEGGREFHRIQKELDTSLQPRELG